MRLLFAGYRRLHLEYLFIYLFICGDLLQSLGPLSTKTPSYGYFSYYLRERPPENHAEWSTDHLSDSLHIWHTYAP